MAQVTDYAQIQEDEIEVLKSMFLEDFVEVKAQPGPWQKVTERAFSLKLKAMASIGEEVSVGLHVVLPATYPKTLPQWKFVFSENIPRKSRAAMEKEVRQEAKALLGQEMIYPIADKIQEELRLTAERLELGQNVPALHEERAVNNARQQQKAQAAKAQLEKHQRETEEEAARELEAVIMAEKIKSLQQLSKELEDPPDPKVEPPDADFIFHREIKHWDPLTKNWNFKAIYLGDFKRQGPISKVYTCRPPDGDRHEPPVFAVKITTLNGLSKADKGRMTALEAKFTELRTKKFRAILSPLFLQLDGTGENWKLWVIMPLAEHSLEDILQERCLPEIKRTRSIGLQLIDALEYLHRENLPHGRVKASNILFVKERYGQLTPKLADGYFQHYLYGMKEDSRVQFGSATSAFWMAPEMAMDEFGHLVPGRDIWDFGIVLSQMLLGLTVCQEHASPAAMMKNLPLRPTTTYILEGIFGKKRPSAFDLLSNAFFRSEDMAMDPPAPIDEDDPKLKLIMERMRRVSIQTKALTPNKKSTRFETDYKDCTRLGKGGFGEVVKARHVLDSNYYAIKIIKQKSAATLDGILNEVIMLSRVNHPNIVRYHNAWLQDSKEMAVEEKGSGDLRAGVDFVASSRDRTGFEDSDDDSDNEEYSGEEESASVFKDSRVLYDGGGGDFNVVFSEDSGGTRAALPEEEDGEKEETETEEEEASSTPEPSKPVQRANRRRSSANIDPARTIYIQMELCEAQTLRGLIKNGGITNSNRTDDMWHILTQILEGLAYVHKSGIVHRDLKPDNIFIADGNKVKIGDFGLARPGEMNLLPTNRDVNDPGGQGHHSAASAGTHFYMAPELRTFVAGKYDQKVDMYAMGIILFEMNYRFGSDAERYHLLTQVRTKAITLPKEMQLPDKANQAQIITTLLTHEPKERPSSMEVLEGGLIPTYIVNDPTRNTVETITTDPKIMEVVFDHQAKHGFTTAQNYNFDDDLKMAHGETLRAKMNVKEILTAVFRRHGALESERSILLPPSDFEKDKAAVRLMTIGGRVVQLPHDLTLPNARILAKNKNLDRHTFTFGHTYRHVAGNMHPTTYGEVNYNLVSLNGLDLALREAEIFKVVDELSEVFPIFDRKSVVININHANILDAMMKYSEIPEDKWAVVKNLLGSYSHLPTQQSKLRTTLREPGIDLSSENVDKLMKFDFRGPLEEAMKKIRNILGEISQELDPTFRHLEALWTYAKRFQVRSTLYICPFSAVNHELYGGNMLFQCLDESSKQKMLIAVGGRYDRLVQEHRAGTQNADCHVVGFQMDWENIVNTWQNLRSSEAKVGKKVKQYYRDEEQVTSLNRIPKRCEVLVDSYHANILRTMGIDIVQELWMANISAELVIDSEIPEGQSGHSQGKDEQYNYVVNLKQDDTLKVRDLAANEEESMRHAELVPWLQAQIRERERLAGHAPPSRAPQSRAVQDTELGQSVVHVLQAQTKSKKFNRAKVEKEAQAALRESTQALSSAPILAVEMNKELFEALRSTRFGDAESWKKFVQSAPVDTRKYLGDLHGDLQQKAAEMKVGNKLCFLFNFRSKASIVIDLGGETK